MALALAGAALAVLSGCASETVLVVPDSAPAEVLVTWARVPREALPAYCAGARRGDREAVACTSFNIAAKTCMIYTASEVTLATLGDEVAHCFLGAWHN